MEVVVSEKVCVLDDLFEIDFDYEFEVAKFFDFTRDESVDEIRDAELWLLCFSGYPPSPLVVKLDQEIQDLEDTEFDSDNVEQVSDDYCAASDVSSRGHGKKGEQIPNTKSKCLNQPLLPKSSRLLKPTASQLAKQNQQSVVNPGRLQKTSGEVNATSKRQKLEIGYLRKFGHLKHQMCLSHKSKKIGATDVKSSTRTKATVPKEPELATARRAQIHRSKSEAQPCNNSKFNYPNTNQSNKKISPNKADSDALRNNKQTSLVLQESKLTSSKKHPHNLPIELFKKLSLNCMDQRNSLPENKHSPLITKGFTKHLSSVMKENKIPDVIPERPKRCCMEKSRSIGRGLSYVSKGIQPVPGA